MTTKYAIGIVNLLLTVIYTAGFGVCYDKQDHVFRLYSRDWTLRSTEKKCNSMNDIIKMKAERQKET